MSETSLQSARDLVEELWAARKAQEAKRDELSEASAKVMELEHKLINVLDSAEMDRLDAESCYVLLGERTSVKMPKDNEERQAFFDYLRARGVYDELISVSSQTLNAFYRSELDLALQRGEVDFTIPGLNDVLVVPKLTVRKK